MAYFDRFDICEAYCVLEWDYNEGGWLHERPSNQRRMESTGVQLHRLQFRPSCALCFDELTDNGKEIYYENILKWKLPIDAEMRDALTEFFTPDYLEKMRPDIWRTTCP